MPKPHQEFFPTSNVDWTPLPAPAKGVSQAILAVDDGSEGVATRLLQFDPGGDTTGMGPQLHDFCEEAYILEGELRDTTLGETFAAGCYASRPAQAPHGPYVSDGGCVVLEVRYPTL